MPASIPKRRRSATFSPKQPSKKGSLSSHSLLEESERNGFLITWLACGNFALSLGSIPTTAINSFENALTYDSYNIQALTGLATAIIDSPNNGDKPRLLHRLVEVINGSINVSQQAKMEIRLWTRLSEAYLLLEDYPKAHSVITTAFEITKDDSLSWLMLGKSTARLGLTREAVDSFRNCLSLLPPQIATTDKFDIARMARLELASIGLNEGNLDMAHSELASTLSLPLPSKDDDLKAYVNIWCFLIMAFERLGDINRAIRVCDNVIAAISDNFRLLLLRSAFLSIENSPIFNGSLAITTLQKLVDKPSFNEQEPADQFIVYFLLAQNFLVTGAFDRCLQYSELCLAKATSEIFQSTIGMLITRLENTHTKSRESPELIANIQNLTKKINQATNSISTLTFRDILSIAAGQYTEPPVTRSPSYQPQQPLPHQQLSQQPLPPNIPPHGPSPLVQANSPVLPSPSNSYYYKQEFPRSQPPMPSYPSMNQYHPLPPSEVGPPPQQQRIPMMHSPMQHVSQPLTPQSQHSMIPNRPPPQVPQQSMMGPLPDYMAMHEEQRHMMAPVPPGPRPPPGPYGPPQPQQIAYQSHQYGYQQGPPPPMMTHQLPPPPPPQPQHAISVPGNPYGYY